MHLILRNRSTRKPLQKRLEPVEQKLSENLANPISLVKLRHSSNSRGYNIATSTQCPPDTENQHQNRVLSPPHPTTKWIIPTLNHQTHLTPTHRHCIPTHHTSPQNLKPHRNRHNRDGWAAKPRGATREVTCGGNFRLALH